MKIRDVLAGDFKAAKFTESKVKLAERLLGLANDKADTPANRYAFFVEAREMYVQVGDMLAAFRAVDELAKSFDRPAFAEKIDLVLRVSKQAKNAGHHRSIAVVATHDSDLHSGNGNKPSQNKAAHKMWFTVRLPLIGSADSFALFSTFFDPS